MPLLLILILPLYYDTRLDIIRDATDVCTHIDNYYAEITENIYATLLIDSHCIALEYFLELMTGVVSLRAIIATPPSAAPLRRRDAAEPPCRSLEAEGWLMWIADIAVTIDDCRH